MKPSELRYRKAERELVLTWEDGTFTLSAEFLRVHSPSAEVQGHDGRGGILPLHKQNVAITGIESIGNYAVRLVFSDGHNTGLYSWDTLRHLCENRDPLWAEYQRAAAESPAADSPVPAAGVPTFRP